MTTITVQRTHFEQVKKFVNLMSAQLFEADLVSGRYTVDAKSLLGIYSLDLSQPVQVVIDSDHCAELLEQLNAFR